MGNSDEELGASGVPQQEVPRKTDVEACWRVIAQQAKLLENQETIIKSLAEGMKDLRAQVATLTSKLLSDDDSRLSVGDLAKIMERRGAPPPTPFEVGKGRSFKKFIEQFEGYCSGKYSPSTKDRWSGELGDHLKGELLQVYKVLGGSEASYTELVTTLKSYCSDHTGNEQSNNLMRFANASLEHGELLHIYAYRLEKLYLAAHPGSDTDFNLELQSKLIASLPSHCVPEIRNQIDTQKNSLEVEIISWSRIVRILKTYSDRVASTNMKPEGTELKSGQSHKQYDPVWFTSTNVGGAPTNERQKLDMSRGRQPKNDQRHFRSRSHSRGPRGPPMNNYVPNTSFNNTSWSQNSGFQRFPKPICEFCGLPGHEMKVCWRYQGCCVRCGSAYHYARDCPEPRRGYGFQHNGANGNFNGRYRQRNNHSHDRSLRSRSYDRENYLRTTPLNPNSPSWNPNANNLMQNPQQYNYQPLNNLQPLGQISNPPDLQQAMPQATVQNQGQQLNPQASV